MRNELYRTTQALTDEAQVALRSFLDLLSRTIPSHWPMYNLITELVNNFVYIVKSEDYLLSLLDEFPAPATQWSPSCSYHQPDDGYTCGIWELFHTITMGVIEYNDNLITDREDDYIVTEQAARTIRNYIAHFFGCTTCRDHFLTAFDTCQLNVCDRLSNYPINDINDWMELSYWLFELHNMVNVRLYYEKHSPSHKKQPQRQQQQPESLQLTVSEIQRVLYPSKFYECSACWKEDTVTILHGPTDDDDNDNDNKIGSHDTTMLQHIITSSYRSDMIYQYLRYEYGSRTATTNIKQLRQGFHPVTSSEQSNTEYRGTTSETFTTSTTTHVDTRTQLTKQQLTRRPLSSSSHDQPIMIQLSYAGMFVLCTVLLNMSSKFQTHNTYRRRKLKVA